ncbi:MAG: sigma-70 family RNA polymerase sigma factor [Candidatus Binatia bacterium]|jgi:RNA polymerase sigma-70 factor, ECF subfamily|nr:sigma-70 family RNA polymerase sigma factor [Candidatus Binatia bacterium]
MFAEGIGDAECVRRVQQGDTDSFEVLVRRHEKAIFNLIYRLLGNYDEAAEVAQEVFLSAFKSIHQFRGEANFSTWLYRIGLNHASTRRKSLQSSQQRHIPLDGTEVIADGAFDPAKNVEHKEIQQRVQQALNSLDPEDARIVLLRDLQDIPYEDVAEMLDIPVGTVKSRLHRARQALKTSLAPYFHANRKAS